MIYDPLPRDIIIDWFTDGKKLSIDPCSTQRYCVYEGACGNCPLDAEEDRVILLNKSKEEVIEIIDTMLDKALLICTMEH